MANSIIRWRGDSDDEIKDEWDRPPLQVNTRRVPADWGNLHTWLVISALCLGFLAFTAFVYFLPYGRHNQNDGPLPTPSIRIY